MLERFSNHLELITRYGDVKNRGLCEIMRDYINYEAEEGSGLSYSDLFHPMEMFMDECFRLWPNFSGDVCYPVPSPYKDIDAYDAFYLLAKWDASCDTINPYGKLREDLTVLIKVKLDKLLKGCDDE